MSVAPATEAVHGATRPPSPYVGLVPYDVEDAAFFFGRSTEVGIVVANLRSAPLTILYGPSGVGKSSLLMAGAVHELCQEAKTAAAETPFTVCVFQSWHDDAVRGLRHAARVALQKLAGDGHLLPPAPTLAETLRAWTKSSGTLLVILDQFEEYFQYHPDEGGDEDLTGFAAELAQIVNDPSLPVHVLLSIREDSWAKLDLFEGHIPSLFANYVRVDHLDRPSAQEAIEGPIDAWNETLSDDEVPYEIEPALVEAVLDATAGGGLTLTAGVETPAVQASSDRVEAPFLQLVLERLWRDAVASKAHTLTLARLEALGGAAKIVENHLLDALGGLTPSEQDTASDCFRFLVSASETKIAHPASNLAEWTGRSEAEVTAVLDKLCAGEAGHILRAIAPSEDGGGKSYELFHDILAGPVLDWRKEHEQRRHQAAEAERQRAVRRRYMRIGAVLVALVAVFAGLGIWAFHERGRAKSATRSATSVALASVAHERLAAHVDDSLLLSLSAYRERPTLEARSSMISALEKAGRSGLEGILHGVPGAVSAVALSPDGSTLAVAGSDETDGVVQLWDVRTRRKVGQLGPLHVFVVSVAFSTDAGEIAVTGGDGKVRRWNLRTQPPTALAESLEGTEHVVVTSVAFGGDGRTVAVGSDGSVRFWDTRLHKGVGPPLPSGYVHDVVFSPDGRMLASAGGDGTVRLWDVRTHRQLGPPLRGHGSYVSGVAFSPDGRTLASAGGDEKVRLWDVRRHQQLGPLDGLNDIAVSSVAFGPDGRTLVIGGRGGVVLRDTGKRPEKRFDRLDVPGRRFFVQSVAFSPEGSALAVAYGNGKVRLWDMGTQPPTLLATTLAGPRGISVASLAFSPDGSTLAVAYGDGKVRLWDMDTQPPTLRATTLDSPNGISVASVAFGPDGRTLAASYGDGSVRLWDMRADPPAPLDEALDGSEGVFVSSVSFSPDRHTLAVITGQSQTALQLWNTNTHRMRVELGPGEANSFTGVAFDADGSIVGVAYGDGSVRFWDVDEQTELGRPLAANDAKGVAISSDGTVAIGSGSSVVLWRGVLWPDDTELETQVCGFVWGNFSREEWDELTHDVAYRASCD